jgi:hypothetical protein
MTFSKTYLAFEMTFSSPSFYTTVFLCTAVIFLFEYGVMTIRINLFPSCADYFRVLVSKKQSKITEREAGEIHWLHDKHYKKKRKNDMRRNFKIWKANDKKVKK